MSGTARRRLADAIVAAALRLLPAGLASWGWAIRQEVDAIEDDREALGFALDSLRGLVPQIVAFHLSGGSIDMGMFRSLLGRPRRLGIACGITACGLGLTYLAMAGAPAHYLAVNAGALAVALLVVALVGRMAPQQVPASVALTLGALLLVTALVGDKADGASRWLMFGPLFLQPSLIVVPIMIASYAQARGILASAGLMLAALALALQPDRAMAGVLFAALAALAVARPDRALVAPLAGAALAFAATMVQPDTLPAVPYVDQILYRAFDVHLVAGLVVLGGSLLLIVPALAALVGDDHRATYVAFAVTWAAIVGAAALGNYPTPLVGYGGSAVIGYVLSVALLPRRSQPNPVGDRPVTVRDGSGNLDLPMTIYLPTN